MRFYLNLWAGHTRCNRLLSFIIIFLRALSQIVNVFDGSNPEPIIYLLLYPSLFQVPQLIRTVISSRILSWYVIICLLSLLSMIPNLPEPVQSTALERILRAMVSMFSFELFPDEVSEDRVAPSSAVIGVKKKTLLAASTSSHPILCVKPLSSPSLFVELFTCTFIGRINKYHQAKGWADGIMNFSYCMRVTITSGSRKFIFRCWRALMKTFPTEL